MTCFEESSNRASLRLKVLRLEVGQTLQLRLLRQSPRKSAPRILTGRTAALRDSVRAANVRILVDCFGDLFGQLVRIVSKNVWG